MPNTEWMIDCEFSEDGASRPIELISIALVSSAGHEYYAVSSEFKPELCNAWVRSNVIPHLYDHLPANRDVRWLAACTKPRAQIKQDLIELIKKSPERPEFWGYYADYDWVLFCQLFGAMVDLPPGWPMFCMDLRQLMEEYRVLSRDMPEDPPGFIEHHALWDARKQMQQLAFMNRFHRRYV